MERKTERQLEEKHRPRHPVERSFLASAWTPVQGQRGLEGLCQWPMFWGGIIKGFRSDQKQEQYNLCNLTVAYISWLACERRLAELKVAPNSFQRLDFDGFYSHSLSLDATIMVSKHFLPRPLIFLVCSFFTAKYNRSRLENLERGQNRFEPIKLVNSVVRSPFDTATY